MADYLDRVAVIDALYNADAITMRGVQILNTMPRADAVEVVRCRDCKHSDTFPQDGEEHEMPLKCLGIRYGGVKGDWYCEHGERR